MDLLYSGFFHVCGTHLLCAKTVSFQSDPARHYHSITNTMNSQDNPRVPYWLPSLEGRCNWAHWRRNIEEAIYEVDQTDVYWNIIVNKNCDVIKKELEDSSNCSSDPVSNQSSDFNGSDPDVIITGATVISNQGSPGFRGSSFKSHSWRVLNIRARQILGSSLERGPRMMIDRVSDAHEAYTKLESLYGGTSAQAIFVAHEKWLRVRYINRGLPAAKFVDRFKSALQDVKDLAVEVSPTMALATFQQAIKPHTNTTNFMANMKVDIYDPDLMEKVYEDFLNDQAPANQQPGMGILDSLYSQ